MFNHPMPVPVDDIATPAPSSPSSPTPLFVALLQYGSLGDIVQHMLDDTDLRDAGSNFMAFVNEVIVESLARHGVTDEAWLDRGGAMWLAFQGRRLPEGSAFSQVRHARLRFELVDAAMNFAIQLRRLASVQQRIEHIIDSETVEIMTESQSSQHGTNGDGA